MKLEILTLSPNLKHSKKVKNIHSKVNSIEVQETAVPRISCVPDSKMSVHPLVM
jgi:hypothetical protein